MDKNSFLISLSESDKTQFGKEDCANQSRPQKVFSAIWVFESEVNNGGFSQYFLNSLDESASFIREAFETIGAPKTADVCKPAIESAFPAGLPRRFETIRSAGLDFPHETLEKLEPRGQEFFAYPHNLTDLLFDFVGIRKSLGVYPSPEL
jgi:hypothetical protein